MEFGRETSPEVMMDINGKSCSLPVDGYFQPTEIRSHILPQLGLDSPFNETAPLQVILKDPNVELGVMATLCDAHTSERQMGQAKLGYPVTDIIYG